MAKKMKKTNNNSKTSPAAYCIPGGMFLGLGIGMLYGNAGTGVVIGLGAGFLGWAILDALKK